MTVVAGVDDSPVSKQVVGSAFEQARWRGSDVHLVHVASTPMVYAEVPVDWGEVIAAQRADVWAKLQALIDSTDLSVERVDLEGYPPDRLVDYARDVDARLLVVGTRGRGELASLILGSTSHRAIHLAGCDVLVVKAEEA